MVVWHVAYFQPKDIGRPQQQLQNQGLSPSSCTSFSPESESEKPEILFSKAGH
jgi:hypothetical protein